MSDSTKSSAQPDLQTTSTTTAAPPTSPSVIKKFLAFCGPGYMIAVGYMDPGNWATDLEGGSRYGYSMLYVILLSNIFAMLLQHLCVRLGVATRQDLAEACRERCPKWLCWALYVVAEVAIVSCDLAEVIGTAIALRMLFGLPVLWGVLITIADVLLLLAGCSTNSARGQRWMEWIVMGLMTVIGGCFIIELFMVKPEWDQVLLGFIPRDYHLFTDRHAILTALGIIGATVMPHNLYLHSSIVKHRLAQEHSDQILETSCLNEEPSTVEQREKELDLDSTIRYATWDSVVALFLALLVNAAILIVAAAAFHRRGLYHVSSIEDAARLMRQWMGPVSAVLFGLALLAAGQSSTVTGTLAGQIVFEGFLKLTLPPWARRLVTRAVAIVPAILIIWWAGEEAIDRLLVWSQVVLSFQLPFAIVPLIMFSMHPPNQGKDLTPSQQRYWQLRKDSRWEWPLRIASWLVAIIIIAFNLLFTVTMLLDT